jgi:hypothetical protein
MFCLTSVPVLSGVVLTFFFISILVLTPHDNFWVVPLVHSVSHVVPHTLLPPASDAARPILMHLTKTLTCTTPNNLSKLHNWPIGDGKGLQWLMHPCCCWPLYQNSAALTHVSLLSAAASTLLSLRDTTQGKLTHILCEYPGWVISMFEW